MYVWLGANNVTCTIITIIVFLDIMHFSNLSKTHNVSGTGFYLCLQVEPTQLGSIDRASSYSGLQHQYKIRYINQAQQKPSARVKTNIKNIKYTTHTHRVKQ
jgi:hypothetical protein